MFGINLESANSALQAGAKGEILHVRVLQRNFHQLPAPHAACKLRIALLEMVLIAAPAILEVEAADDVPYRCIIGEEFSNMIFSVRPENLDLL